MRLRKQVSLFRQFFGSLEVVVFGEVVCPVEQRLPYDRADLGVVKLGSALEDLGGCRNGENSLPLCVKHFLKN